MEVDPHIPRLAWMRRACFVCGLLFLVGLVPRADADNAIPIATWQSGDLQIILFSHSNPVRAGMIELSLMVLGTSGEPVLGWTAHGRLEPVALVEEGEGAWIAPCCRLSPGPDEESALSVVFETGTSSARFAAETAVILARPGIWRLGLTITQPDAGALFETFDIEVASARTPLSQYWLWFAAIPVMVVGYAFSRP